MQKTAQLNNSTVCRNRRKFSLWVQGSGKVNRVILEQVYLLKCASLCLSLIFVQYKAHRKRGRVKVPSSECFLSFTLFQEISSLSLIDFVANWINEWTNDEHPKNLKRKQKGRRKRFSETFWWCIYYRVRTKTRWDDHYNKTGGEKMIQTILV